MMPDADPRYTPNEMFDLYQKFVRDPQATKRFTHNKQQSVFEITRVILQFIAFVRDKDVNRDFKRMEAEVKRQESQLFGQPGGGDLFDAQNPQ